MMVGYSALYRYKEGKPGGRRYDKAGNNQGLNWGGGDKSTGGRQRKVLSKRNQEDKGANTDKA